MHFTVKLLSVDFVKYLTILFYRKIILNGFIFSKSFQNFFILMKVYDVERPETPNELGKNITDNVVRGT